MGIQLQIETTNTCQYACVFCPHDQMQRPQGTMDLALYKRIIDQAATSPVIEKVTLTGLGETLQDRHLVERVRYARQVMAKGVSLDLYTAGGLLRPRIVDQLVDAGLDVLYVSLNAVTREKRREIMQVDDYDAVVAYTKYAIEAWERRARAQGLPADRNKVNDRQRVIVKGVASKDLMEVGEHELFLENWGGDNVKGGNAYLHLEGNWAGSIGAKMRTKPVSACSRALSQIMVLWTGEVSLCCFDAEGAVILGDLRTQTLREIYEGEKAWNIRKAHVDGRRGELALCSTCTAI